MRQTIREENASHVAKQAMFVGTSINMIATKNQNRNHNESKNDSGNGNRIRTSIVNESANETTSIEQYSVFTVNSAQQQAQLQAATCKSDELQLSNESNVSNTVGVSNHYHQQQQQQNIDDGNIQMYFNEVENFLQLAPKDTQIRKDFDNAVNHLHANGQMNLMSAQLCTWVHFRSDPGIVNEIVRLPQTRIRNNQT